MRHALAGRESKRAPDLRPIDAVLGGLVAERVEEQRPDDRGAGAAEDAGALVDLAEELVGQPDRYAQADSRPARAAGAVMS